jgi:hypothetical protein
MLGQQKQSLSMTKGAYVSKWFPATVTFAECHPLRCFNAPTAGKQSFNLGGSFSEGNSIMSIIALPRKRKIHFVIFFKDVRSEKS